MNRTTVAAVLAGVFLTAHATDYSIGLNPGGATSQPLLSTWSDTATFSIEQEINGFHMDSVQIVLRGQAGTIGRGSWIECLIPNASLIGSNGPVKLVHTQVKGNTGVPYDVWTVPAQSLSDGTYRWSMNGTASTVNPGHWYMSFTYEWSLSAQ